MKRFASFLAALLLVSFACFVQAGPTHLGQSAYDHVTLVYTTSPSSPCGDGRGFFRVWADGSLANDEYKVPAGNFLMITDVKWNARGIPTAFSEGRLVTFYLNATKPDGTITGEVLEAQPVVPNAQQVASYFLGGSDQILAGARVGPWRHLCPRAISEDGTGSAVNTVKRAWIYGYHIAK